MRSTLFATTLALTLACGATSLAFGETPMREVERGYELSAADVTLPASADGIASFPACDSHGCKTVTARATAATRYFINGQPVALVDLHQLAARGAAPMTVFYKRKTGELSRIKATAPPASTSGTR